MSTAAPAAPRPVERGVVEPPWRDEKGERFVVGVDRHGRERFRAPMPAPADYDEQMGRLYDELDRIDPQGVSNA